MDNVEKLNQRIGAVIFDPISYGQGNAQQGVLETTIVCPDSPDCCGCVNGKRDKTGVIFFTCNECGQEVGRGFEE